ncbi:D-alanyl-D-alanine carboxypeptidase/D-alanyl-D-alanine endopeptidase [Deinococcus humi]|uniref:D-alanyl-D-alanine carboxypeptidase/D-alanyl-D-alanine-endopeptidase (Penicillin-binding protein 4) n=1 Tax=Deinococcus humi TaxID=662880 RepID=A0A7W8JZS6_9DEIO|nr:D-alanyl-D-alanine carboxypeptidase/D-alanyl-D-alanine-endopeptidase [Deinococcus humi]MBB5365858.1 D-alanyl-D-alanine carboxypeptidase/D-alanyl-D-alanine-endopeptidase (penicillin-binding protein 4) [Deinococcus humi]
MTSFAAQNDPATVLQRGPLKADGLPATCRAHTGVLVQDAQTGETLMAFGDQEAFVPASTTKAVTTAAALYTLGETFTFKTHVLASPVRGGRVARLTLRGSGDPTLRERGAGNSLEALAQAVAASGVETVDALQIDDFAFAQARWGHGWMWDDTEYPVGALRLDGDAATSLRLVVNGDEARAGLQPNPAMLTDPTTLALSVGQRFAALLRASNMTVSGTVVRARAGTGDWQVAEVQSAPLTELVRQTNKPSNNIYAEQLRAALGMEPGGGTSDETRASAALESFMRTTGVAGEGYRLCDGSGLSRYNLLTPRHLNAVLRYAYLNPLGTVLPPAEAFELRQNAFIESLPVAGTGDANPEAGANGGTLRNRLKGTGLDVRAKTGSMTGVSSLSGFLVANSGRLLIFTFLMDNYPTGVNDLNRWQDELLLSLAGRY